MTDSRFVKINAPPGHWPRQLYKSNDPEAQKPHTIAAGLESPPLNAKHTAILDLNELGCSAEEFRLLSDGTQEVWIGKLSVQRAKPLDGPTQSALGSDQGKLVDSPEVMEVDEVLAIPEMFMVYDLSRKMLRLVPAAFFDGKRSFEPCNGIITETLTAKEYVERYAPAYNWPPDLYLTNAAKPEDRYSVVPHTKEVPQDVAAAYLKRITVFYLRYRGKLMSSIYGLVAASQVHGLVPTKF